MGDALKRLPQVITEPVAAFRALRDQPAMLLGTIVVVISESTLMFSAYEIDPSSGTLGFPETGGTVQGGLGLTVTGAILNLVVFWIGTAVAHFFSRGFGGSGSYKGLFTAMAFASLPQIFQAPVYLIARAAGVVELAVLGYIAFGIWSLVLGVLAVREAERLSTARSFAAFVLALIVVGILGIFVT